MKLKLIKLATFLTVLISYQQSAEAGFTQTCKNLYSGTAPNMVQVGVYCEFTETGLPGEDNSGNENPGGHESNDPNVEAGTQTRKQKYEGCTMTATGKYNLCLNNAALAGATMYNSCFESNGGFASGISDVLYKQIDRKCRLQEQTMLTATRNQCELDQVKDKKACIRKYG